MVDGASLIGGAFQGDAGHEGWGGFVEVVICLVWCVSVVTDAPGWAAGWYRRSRVVLFIWLHWSLLPCPSVCGGAVRGRVKRRDGPDGR